MKIGPYETIAELGRGSAGIVSRARSPDGRVVAVKLLRRTGPESLARFERERRLLATLGEREGFVPLLDAGESKEGPYLVMPLLAGGTLRDRLRRGPLAVEEAVALGLSLSRALARAHERGIVHRDLKPENVLFTGEGVPLVADLGLAKHFAEDAPGAGTSLGLSKTGDFRGTAGYMAPEQMSDAKRAGPPVDVFALGAIMAECLTGAPLFSGDTTIEVIAKVEACRFEPISSVRPDAPPWLERVLARALAKDPRDRFPEAAGFARALESRASAGRARALVVAAILLIAGLSLGIFLVVSEKDDEPASGTPVSNAATPAKVDARPKLPPEEKKASEPRTARAFVERAGVRLDTNDVDGAIADCTRAIELDGRIALAWSYRAHARAIKLDVDGQLSDADRAIALDPKLAGGWAHRAAARMKKHDDAGAIEDATRAIELDPRLSGAWATRAIARERKDDLDGAYADYTKAVELEPKNGYIWYSRGGILYKQGDFARAVEDCTKSIELRPRAAEAWSARAMARLGAGDREGGISDMERARSLVPETDPQWKLFDDALRRLRNP
ncbi:tetratricopeptide repeat protein [bacterium]|nr:tetratricopeptide repeat protein [bacterium]